MKKHFINRCSKHLTTVSFFCMLAVCAVFSSCGDDEEENLTVSKENINGIWELKNESGYEDGEHYSQNCSNTYYIIEIPNYRRVRKDRDTGEWEVSRPQSCSFDSETQTVCIGRYEYEIQQLTSKKLQWKFSDDKEGWWQIQTFEKADNDIFKNLGIEF